MAASRFSSSSKVRREQSKVKQMIIFAYDHIGIFLVDTVPDGQS